MKRLARALELLAWGAFFLFAALVLALRFWLLPDIERYREHIVGAMSRSLGLPVRVGARVSAAAGPRGATRMPSTNPYIWWGRSLS